MHFFVKDYQYIGVVKDCKRCIVNKIVPYLQTWARFILSQMLITIMLITIMLFPGYGPNHMTYACMLAWGQNMIIWYTFTPSTFLTNLKLQY